MFICNIWKQVQVQIKGQRKLQELDSCITLSGPEDQGRREEASPSRGVDELWRRVDCVVELPGPRRGPRRRQETGRRRANLMKFVEGFRVTLAHSSSTEGPLRSARSPRGDVHPRRRTFSAPNEGGRGKIHIRETRATWCGVRPNTRTTTTVSQTFWPDLALVYKG